MNYLTLKAQKLTPYVAGIQPREPGWIKLNTNENPYPPSPKVVKFLASADISKLRLYPDMDSTILRQAIASRCNVNPENVFCGNGSDEVLALAYQAFFSGKINILTPDISYGFYPVWGNMYDVNKTYIPLEEDFSINLSRYKGGNGVILANPNAPTGNALTLCEVEQIVQNNPNGAVIIDEAYIDFAGVDSAVPLTHKYENLLVIQTFSKSYSLAGLRVGFAVGSKALMDGLQLMKDAFNPYPLGWLEQQIATITFTDAEYWHKTRKKIMQTRDKTIAELRNMGYAVQDSHTNFIFMRVDERADCHSSHDGSKTPAAQQLYDYLLTNKILARYWQKPRISGFLRVSVGTDAEMEAFLQCVKQF